VKLRKSLKSTRLIERLKAESGFWYSRHNNFYGLKNNILYRLYIWLFGSGYLLQITYIVLAAVAAAVVVVIALLGHMQKKSW